jgi:hypothetical protein
MHQLLLLPGNVPGERYKAVRQTAEHASGPLTGMSEPAIKIDLDLLRQANLFHLETGIKGQINN